MQTAKNLTLAIQIVVNTRKQNSDISAIWNKLDRIAAYLNSQLAEELRNW
jgi:hypothetical protein